MTDRLSAEEQLAYLASLKEEAALLGMEVSGNIKAETLAKRIEKFKEKKEAEKAKAPQAKETPVAKTSTAGTKESVNKATVLKRVIVTCHDPSKSTLEGAIFGAGNSLTGHISKYIKFGEAWHVPQIILNTLLRKEYTLHFQARNPYTREMETRNKQVPAYSVQYLPELTTEEMKTLAKKQALHADNEEKE